MATTSAGSQQPFHGEWLPSGENQAEADCDCNEEVNFADIRYFISILIESLALAKTVLRIFKQVEPSSVHLLVRDRGRFFIGKRTRKYRLFSLLW